MLSHWVPQIMSVVPNLSGTRDPFHERPFFHGNGDGVDGSIITSAHLRSSGTRSRRLGTPDVAGPGLSRSSTAAAYNVSDAGQT